jgi:hypothetical protein
VGNSSRQTLAASSTKQPAGVPLAAYGSERINRANKAGFLVVVESESECWTFWHHEIPALGIPGSGTAKVIEAAHIKTVETIYVVNEKDQGGANFAQGVKDRLSNLKFTGKVYELRMPDGFKDPSDLHIDNPDQFLARFEQCVKTATPIALHNGPRIHAGDFGSGHTKAKPKTPLRHISPYIPPPINALPPPLRFYVLEAATALSCDCAFVLLPVLSVAASLIGNSRVIQLKRGWREPAVVWSVIVADSGTLKTPAYLLAVNVLFKLQRRMRAEHHRQLADFQNKVKEYERKKAAASKRGPNSGEPPEEPIEQRVICSDTTIEKLAELLQNNPRGLLVARDELAAWFNSLSRYKGKAGGSDLPNWLEMHRAGTIIIDRKTAEPKTLYVQRAAVSICGKIQPGVLAQHLTAEFYEAGAAARLLMAMLPKLPKRCSDVEVHPDTETAYEELLESLLALEMDRDKDGERVPFVLKLSRDAKAAWVAFYNSWALEQAASEGEVAAALAKLEAYAARFALIHHVVSCVYRKEDDRREIGVESVNAGLLLCRWFAFEAQRIYTVLGETDHEKSTRQLVEFVGSRGGQITARELQRSNSRKYRNVEEAEAALNALVDAEVAEWQNGETPAHGGHRQRWLVLRPTHDTSDTRLPDSENNEPPSSDTCADTPREPCVFPGENERVSEVSCVGHDKSETVGAPAPALAADAKNGECRPDVEYEEGDA